MRVGGNAACKLGNVAAEEGAGQEVSGWRILGTMLTVGMSRRRGTPILLAGLLEGLHVTS